MWDLAALLAYIQFLSFLYFLAENWANFMEMSDILEGIVSFAK